MKSPKKAINSLNTLTTFLGVIFIVIGIVGYAASFVMKAVSPRPPSSQTPKITLIVSQEPKQTTIKLFFVATQDNGKIGKKIGCNDSLVEVKKQVSYTPTPLKAAFEELLKITNQYYNKSELYNSLYQSKLTIESATIQKDTALVYLKGTHALGGVCDLPRFSEQLTSTALQFPNIKKAEIFINNKPLSEIISEKGSSL